MEFFNNEFFDRATDMLCIAGVDGYLKRVNPAFERVLGWTSEELRARPFVEFVHPDDVADTWNEIKRLGAGESVDHFENRWRGRDERYRVLRWNAVPDAAGLFFAIAHDITDDVAAFHNFVVKINELETRLKVSRNRLEYLAVTDSLSGLRNQRSFEDALQMIGRIASRAGGWMSLVLLDIDDARPYYDRHGQQAIDKVLSDMGDLILGIARRSDVAARLGGTEFVVILPGTPSEGAAQFAGRLVEAVESHEWPHEPITVGIGVSTVEFAPGETARLKWNLGKIVSDAQGALKQSKEAGKNQVTHAGDLSMAAAGSPES